MIGRKQTDADKASSPLNDDKRKEPEKPLNELRMPEGTDQGFVYYEE
jgi:hypothetical protein